MTHFHIAKVKSQPSRSRNRDQVKLSPGLDVAAFTKTWLPFAFSACLLFVGYQRSKAENETAMRDRIAAVEDRQTKDEGVLREHATELRGLNDNFVPRHDVQQRWSDDALWRTRIEDKLDRIDQRSYDDREAHRR